MRQLRIPLIISNLASQKTLLPLVSVLAVVGTVTMLTGGVWDATSHTLREPERFWSIQHVAVYAGVAMIASSGIVGGMLLLKQRRGNYPVAKITSRGIKVIIIGSIIQIAAGYGDSVSHDVFGIDGLVSLTHQPLETGLVLSALGAYLVISSTGNQFLRRLLPFTIITLILSASWVVFNLMLLVGGTILCIPVYQIFSSGCAIL